MKKIYLLLLMAFMLASCSAQLNKKVEVSFPDGKPQIVRYYDKHDQCVKEMEYYESGQVKMEGAIKNGKREGRWKAYLRDGRPWSIDDFSNGVLDGSSTVYWENGNLRWEGYYKSGKHSGHWKWYDEQGNLLREEDYPE